MQSLNPIALSQSEIAENNALLYAKTLKRFGVRTADSGETGLSAHEVGIAISLIKQGVLQKASCEAGCAIKALDRNSSFEELLQIIP